MQELASLQHAAFPNQFDHVQLKTLFVPDADATFPNQFDYVQLKTLLHINPSVLKVYLPVQAQPSDSDQYFGSALSTHFGYDRSLKHVCTFLL